MSASVRILGIDPGSQVTGYGIVDAGVRATQVVAWGSIRTRGDHAQRLKDIFEAFDGIVREYQPAEIAIERVFLHRNADSALKLGQARAAALCGTFGVAADVHEYSPRHIKKAVVGTGSAEKSQVQQMIGMLLGIRESIQADAADALAVAVCHAHSRGTHAMLLSAARA
ncbi:MAG: crossover junction endodeoxyribonuclease RuvC [Gammaproteobacteria bacterium]|jgi:crossover junction endodeoxyribonuclease RuvC